VKNFKIAMLSLKIIKSGRKALMSPSKPLWFGRIAVVILGEILMAGLLGAEIAPGADTPEVLPGDLIFQESKSGQAAAIKDVTGSRYSHCGIVVKRDGKLFVAEAIEPVRVVATKSHPLRSIEEWIGAGVDKHAVLKRVHGGLTPERLQQIEQSMLRFQGKPYDVLFQWSDDKIYCSEFIYDSFNDPALEEKHRIDLGTVQTFSQLNLEGELAKKLIKKRYTEEGKQIDPNEKIITPVAVLNDSKLDTVAMVDEGRIHSPPSPAATVAAKSAALPNAGFILSDSVKHAGQSDGSAGVAVGEDHFIGASDENNVLRLYSSDSSDPGKDLLDLNPLLGFEKEEGEFKECDIEGAARIEDLIFWIGSHGLNKKGHVKESRRVLFATVLSGSGANVRLTLKGVPCKSLMDSFMAIPELKSAAAIKPEDKGGLNIESLCAKGSSLLIGFRNPVSDQGALVVPLLNPLEVIDGKPPVLGESFRVNLQGRGIRDMARWRGQFLIVAGDYQDRTAPGAKTPQLFKWSGNPQESPVPIEVELGDLNPEAAVTYGQECNEKLQLLSDDGGEFFRSVWVKTSGPH
jgi:hypothetical protein